jgi:hypothetical protein
MHNGEPRQLLVIIGADASATALSSARMSADQLSIRLSNITFNPVNFRDFSDREIAITSDSEDVHWCLKKPWAIQNERLRFLMDNELGLPLPPMNCTLLIAI